MTTFSRGMTLHHPTVADRALAAWRTKKYRTVELAVRSIGEPYNISRTNWPPRTYYNFDDDTQLQVSGKGKSHLVEALLP